MAEYLSGAYFEVFLAGAGAVLAGRFTAVSGLGASTIRGSFLRRPSPRF